MKFSLKLLFLPVSKMDSIWFKRLSSYVKEGLGDIAISVEALSHITILVMEFVDSFASTLAQPMDAAEKHSLAVSWVDQFVYTYCDGKKLSPDIAKLNSEWISRACELSKGESKLHSGHQPSIPATAALVAPVVQATPTPALAPKKKSWTLFKTK